MEGRMDRTVAGGLLEEKVKNAEANSKEGGKEYTVAGGWVEQRDGFWWD